MPHQTSTILSLLSDLARNSSLSNFLSEGPKTNLTYHAAHILATQLIPARLSQLFPDLRRRPHVRVAIISTNNALYPLVLWALWSLGVVAVPLSASADPTMWVSMASVTHASLLLVARDLRPKLKDALSGTAERPTVVDLESLVPSEFYKNREQDILTQYGHIQACNQWVAMCKSGTIDPIIDFNLSPDTPIVTLFTSSAVDAATLKSVTYTHAMLVASARRTIEALGDDVYRSVPKRHLGWLPLSHCFELTVSLCGIVLMSGGTYVLHDSRNSSPFLSGATSLSETILESLVYHQPIQSFCTVPAILEKLPRGAPSKYLAALRRLDSICVGGAPSAKTLYDWALQENIPYVDFLGATEVAGGICTRVIQQTSAHGLKMMDGLMGVLEKRNLSDDFGELIILGKDLPTRYDNLESPAFTTLSPGGETVYRTGDIYSQDAEFPERSVKQGGSLPSYDPCATPLAGLHYIGRVDDILTLNSGIKVDALGIERALDSLPEIRKSAVVLNAEGDALVALVEAETVSPSARHEIVDAVLRMNSHLAFEKRLRQGDIHIVPSLPLTTKSTLHRKKIKKIIRDAGGSWPQVTESHSCLSSNCTTSSTSYTSVQRAHTASNQLEWVHEQLKTLIAHVLSIPAFKAFDPSLSFSKLGMTSLSFVRLASAIQETFMVEVKTSQLYGFSSIAELCVWITQAREKNGPPSVTGQLEMNPRAGPNVSDNLAITGASCRFPGGVNNLSSFWEALVSPTKFSESLACPRPPSRWSDTSVLDLPTMGWIQGLEYDDLNSFCSFFELRPTDVKTMTPNSRLALKLAYNAIEDAGIAPKSLDGKSWGIFSSVNDSGWQERRLAEVDLEEYGKALGGVADDAVGARLSYFLNLTGPAIEVKTACSSSAVAVHQACAAIRNGDCEAAIVVSATTHFFPAGSVFRKAAGIASHHGRCATFSQDADGFLPSEGAAAIVIQKSTDAYGDIYAYIRGSAITQDGRSQGFAAPNPVAQTRLLNMALHQAGAVPDDLSYIETHGTGTRLGDAIEIAALNQAFGPKRTRPLMIGAVKAVIGHTEECAGLAGIIKSLLCFHHNAIPPQAHLGNLNTELDLFASKLVIPRRVASFVDSRRPRLIGVSSFGLSGTLAHIILQEPAQIPLYAPRPAIENIFVISAQSSADLSASLSSWLEYAESPLSRESPLEDICFTTQVARDVFRYRYAWPVLDWATLHSHLRQASKSNLHSRTPNQPTISIWFGAPYFCHVDSCLPAIDHPIYHSTMVECATATHGLLPGGLIYYAKQLALARTLSSLGCRVVSVGGEGPGEFVAAAFSGTLDISSLFRLLSAMEPLRGQEAVAFEAPIGIIMERLSSFKPQDIRVRAQHREDQTTIIGNSEAVHRFQSLNEDLACLGVQDTLSLSLRYDVSVTTSPGHHPIVSPHLGDIIGEELLLNKSYWNGVLNRGFNSQCAWEKMGKLSDLMIILGRAEFGPRDGILSHCNGESGLCGDKTSSNLFLARLFERGCDLDWKALNIRGSIVRLPVYQWALDAK